MTNFLQSISRGLDAHQESLAARNEIAAIITTLHDQLLSATEERVGARIWDVAVSLTESMEFPGGGGISEAPALVLFSVQYPDVFHRLCLIKVPLSGYPVLLKIGREKLSCSDRESLEIAIAGMLATAASGKAITDLRDYQPGAGDF